jgi:transposase
VEELLKILTKKQLAQRVLEQESIIHNLQDQLNSDKNLQKELSEKISYLQHQISLFQKALFGDKKESYKIITAPEQTKIEFAEKVDLDLPQDIEQQEITYRRKKVTKKREDYSKLELPGNLERVVTVIEPIDKEEGDIQIGIEATEVLAITPEKFYVKRTERPKYAKAGKEGVIIAPMPSRPIQGGKVDVSFLVQIILDKYVDHMPLYRQLKKYERLGVKLSDSTIGDWVHQSIKLLEYLYEELVRQVKSSHYLQADETTIKVLDKNKKGTTHRGYYWVYHAVKLGLVLYEYNESRGQSVPSEFLEEYIGYLQVDGYTAYTAIENENLILLNCMAHARRYFHEALQNDKAKSEWMLNEIQGLYEIEQQAREQNMDDEKRLALRKEKSVPILEKIKEWLTKNKATVLPSSAIGKAINYMHTRINELMVYTTNGSLEIDNNMVENVMRPVALGRKNYLFAGSHEAARRAGIVYSFIACCKKNGYDPYTWLEETLTKLPDTKKLELYKLLPIKK